MLEICKYTLIVMLEVGLTLHVIFISLLIFKRRDGIKSEFNLSYIEFRIGLSSH